MFEDYREHFPSSSPTTSAVEQNKEFAFTDSLHEPLTHELAIQKEAFNEFSTVNLASLVFPTIFPDDKGG